MNTMSLRAKIEAVIYAAEEPVTLVQLAAIFAPEVPADAWRNPFGADVNEGQEPSALTLIEEGFLQASSFGFDADMAEAALMQGLAERDKAKLAETETEAETPSQERSQDPGNLPDSSEAEAKRAARHRDREVRDYLRRIVDSLIDEYAKSDRGMEIREVAGGYRVATKPEYHDAVRAFVKSLKPPMKLSLQALETLAVIAYKQPITGPEIAEIRGVDSGGVLGSLMSRKLITTAGRKQVIGRPILYKTTREFLLRFGLKDLNELPSIEEFEKLAGDLDLGEEELAEEQRLPLDQSGEAADDAQDAAEANAGEPGLAVESGEGADSTHAPETVALSAEVPEAGVSEDIAVTEAAHPATPIAEDGSAHETGEAKGGVDGRS
jgi:segregation and condensation protein B